MEKLVVGSLQGNFRSSFSEKIPEIAKIAQYREVMGPDDYRYNQELLITLAREAAKKGAKLVVGPESYLDGWSGRPETLQAVAMTIPSQKIDELCGIAAELDLWMCVGIIEKVPDGIFNTALLISSGGKIAGIYRKTHEVKYLLEELPFYHLGDDAPVFDTPWGRMGMVICHDRWYPELARTLQARGAEVVLNPSAAGVFCPHHKYQDIHRCSMRTQAYQNSVFWVNCNSANHGGGSLIIGPDGTVIAEGPLDQGVVVAELDPAQYSKYDFISNLRPRVYSAERVSS